MSVYVTIANNIFFITLIVLSENVFHSSTGKDYKNCFFVVATVEDVFREQKFVFSPEVYEI
jgi:hypothetical protein